jgi:hypothetical protein
MGHPLPRVDIVALFQAFPSLPILASIVHSHGLPMVLALPTFTAPIDSSARLAPKLSQL